MLLRIKHISYYITPHVCLLLLSEKWDIILQFTLGFAIKKNTVANH